MERLGRLLVAFLAIFGLLTLAPILAVPIGVLAVIMAITLPVRMIIGAIFGKRTSKSKEIK